MFVIDGIGGLAVRALLGALSWLAWLVPRMFVPRRADWIAVLGRGDGAFVDNCKYFYIAAQADSRFRVTYVTSHDTVVTALRTAGVPVVRYPSLKARWLLLRAGSAVVDTTEWSQRGRRALLAGSRVVQLWHGVGFKRIELDRWRKESTGRLAFGLRYMLYRLSGRLIRYDAVVTTSRFYARELFTRAFLSQYWLPANYPRNTFGRGAALPELVRVGVDTDAAARIDAWANEGMSIVLIAPTFRDDGSHSLPMTPGEREHIAGFCRQKCIRLVFKMHPLDTSKVILPNDVAVVCASRSDIYPLLGSVQALVTDYSSIYLDFLAADRPILFHMPDLSRYVAAREPQFDIADMTVGARSTCWDQLLGNLLTQLHKDDFRMERQRLRALAFDEHEPIDASAAILDHLYRDRSAVL